MAISILLTMFGMVVCLLITLFADFIVHLLYRNQYGDASGILQIYVWSFLLICFASIFSKWLRAENLRYLNFRFTAIALTINLVGNFVLIPLFSLKGVAIAAVAAQFIPFPLLLLLEKKLSKRLRELVDAL